jgi:hypothetical protein
MKCKKGKQKCHNSGINFGKKNGNNILQLIVIYIIRKTYRAPPRILSRWNEDEHYLSRSRWVISLWCQCHCHPGPVWQSPPLNLDRLKFPIPTRVVVTLSQFAAAQILGPTLAVVRIRVRPSSRRPNLPGSPFSWDAAVVCTAVDSDTEASQCLMAMKPCNYHIAASVVMVARQSSVNLQQKTKWSMTYRYVTFTLQHCCSWRAPPKQVI